jgi:hypothetical protein
MDSLEAVSKGSNGREFIFVLLFSTELGALKPAQLFGSYRSHKYLFLGFLACPFLCANIKGY